MRKSFKIIINEQIMKEQSQQNRCVKVVNRNYFIQTYIEGKKKERDKDLFTLKNAKKTAICRTYQCDKDCLILSYQLYRYFRHSDKRY
jgi:hypothetical protein